MSIKFIYFFKNICAEKYINYMLLFLKCSCNILGLKDQAAPFLSISLAPLRMQDMSQFVWCDIAWTHRSSSRGRLDWRRRSSRRAYTRRRKPWAQWGVNACREGCSLLPLLAIPSAVSWASCLSTFSPDHATRTARDTVPCFVRPSPVSCLCLHFYHPHPRAFLTPDLIFPFPLSCSHEHTRRPDHRPVSQAKLCF